MSKIKNYMMDIEEKVFDIDGLETKIGECEHSRDETLCGGEVGFDNSF